MIPYLDFSATEGSRDQGGKVPAIHWANTNTMKR